MAIAIEAALVTGATRGIGRAVAQRLASEGHRVVGLARRDSADFPGTLRCVDLEDEAQTRATLSELAEQYAFTRVVLNAGLNVLQPIEDVDLGDFDRVIGVNLRAAIQCVQAALPAMRARKWGRIVSIASRSLLGRRRATSYAAAKAGIVAASRTWALELAADGITANVVAPGPIDTEMWRTNNPPDSPDARSLVNAIPVGRLGTCDEVAGAVSYFLSPEASFTTGQVLFVCGGLSVGSGA
jgi:NAD(P)-dependent dehydrogenase (short-subunit alcohol dehydrogenase family)